MRRGGLVGRRARTNTAHVQGLPSVSVMYVCGHALRFVTFVFLTNIFQYGWVYGPSLSNEVARLIDEHLERLAEENTVTADCEGKGPSTLEGLKGNF